MGVVLHRENSFLKNSWLKAGSLFDNAGTFTAGNGDEIRYGIAEAEGPKRGNLVLTHGYGEHIDLYHETIRHYQRMGFTVYAMDWHGHGLSGRDDPENRLKPSDRGLRRHVSDLDDFVKNIVRHDAKEGPLVMATSSMGGHVATLYMQQHPDTFDGVMMNAPMLDIYRLGLPKPGRSVIRGLFNTLAAAGFEDMTLPRLNKLGLTKQFNKVVEGVKSVFNFVTGRKPEPFNPRAAYTEATRQQMHDAQLNDPHVGWLVNTFETTDELMRPENLEKIQSKVLIFSAGRDKLVENGAHAVAARHIPDAEHITFANADHGIWFESDDIYYPWLTHQRDFLDRVVAEHNREHGIDSGLYSNRPPYDPALATLAA